MFAGCRSQDLNFWPAPKRRGSTLGPGLKLLYKGMAGLLNTVYLSWQKTITETCNLSRLVFQCFPVPVYQHLSTVSLFSNLFRLLGRSPRFHSGVLSAPFSRSLELRGPGINSWTFPFWLVHITTFFSCCSCIVELSLVLWRSVLAQDFCYDHRLRRSLLMSLQNEAEGEGSRNQCLSFNGASAPGQKTSPIAQLGPPG